MYLQLSGLIHRILDAASFVSRDLHALETYKTPTKVPAHISGACCCAVQVMWCAVVIVSIFLYTPHDPREANPVLISQLQEFAWTEKSLKKRMKVSLESGTIAC